MKIRIARKIIKRCYGNENIYRKAAKRLGILAYYLEIEQNCNNMIKQLEEPPRRYIPSSQATCIYQYYCEYDCPELCRGCKENERQTKQNQTITTNVLANEDDYDEDIHEPWFEQRDINIAEQGYALIINN